MSQLSKEQCIQLHGYYKKITTNQQSLADLLWVNQSTISRELMRCHALWTWYNIEFAWKDRIDKRDKANNDVHTKIILWSELANYIEKNLLITWSPEQIAWRWKAETWETITHPTIYSFIYEHRPEKVVEHLRRKGKKYKKNGYKKNKIPNRVSIHDRPEIVEERTRIWDFEWDTIVWKDTADRIITNVDRTSRYLLADLILRVKEESLSIATSVSLFRMFQKIPKDKIHTETLDNWVEFFDHEYIYEMLWIWVYFADPYSSWQRWTNENTNWLLRYFFPKWTDFKNITNEQLQKCVYLINNRPRKCLWFKTATEVFFQK